MSITTSDLFALHTYSQPVAVPDGVIVVENWLDQASNSYHSRLRYFGEKPHDLGFDRRHDTAPKLALDHSQLAWLSRASDGTTQIFSQNWHGVAVQRTWFAQGVKRFFWDHASRGWFVQPNATAAPDGLPHPLTITHQHYQQNGIGVIREDLTHELWHQGFLPQARQLIYHSSQAFTLKAVGATKLVIEAEAQTYDRNGAPKTTVSFISLADQQVVPIFSGNGHVQDLADDEATVLLTGDPLDRQGFLGNTLFTIHDGQLHRLLADDDLEVGRHVISDTQYHLTASSARFTASGQVIFTYSRAGGTYLAQTASDGTFTTLTTPPGTVGDFALAQDGSVYYTYTNHTTVSALYHDTIKLATSMPDWPAAAPEVLHFKQGDYTIAGWYFRPQTTKPHPLLLSVHGGPHAAYGNSYMHEFQVYLSQGYGVLALNPRGSATYGLNFLAAGIGDYGGGDFADLMAGVDQALQLDPLIDPTKLFLTGGSYGGFIANWAQTHTTRFAGIISERAISDWVSFLNTSDIGYYFAPRELGGTDHATLWRQSPLAYADAAQTPMLLIHSSEDLRVPLSQGEEFYTALKRRGVPVTLLRFPASNHELSRSGLPNLRYERLAASVQWFNDLQEHEG
ncbi:alpha/beta hydrolase family protein [Lacticaseibacillus rhamnosus]|uniref:alpha/beta hydrolase family protein n=1 Tax=Lacticaseibacillus TaxID=2759736 RepID=UPI003DA8288F